jgi:cell division protein FtsN
LLLLNLVVTIEKVKARNGDSWHRVIVGPFKSRSKLAKARSILATHQIDSLLLKRQ